MSFEFWNFSTLMFPNRIRMLLVKKGFPYAIIWYRRSTRFWGKLCNSSSWIHGIFQEQPGQDWSIVWKERKTIAYLCKYIYIYMYNYKYMDMHLITYIWFRVPCCQPPPPPTPHGMGPKPTFWLHFHGARQNTWYLQCFDKLGLRNRGICSVL